MLSGDAYCESLRRGAPALLSWRRQFRRLASSLDRIVFLVVVARWY
jgi:hypothetical protein